MTDFNTVSGDTLRIRVALFTDDTRSTPLNLTGKVLTFGVADRAVDPLVSFQKTVGDGITVLDAGQGSALVVLGPADTALVGARGGVLRYYLRVTEGSDVYTADRGKISISRLIP